MFFDRLIRNIVIFLIVFVVAINIYYYTIAIQFGTENEYNMVGFYSFFKNFEQMPRFETFVQSWQDMWQGLSTWSAWRTGLAFVTLGISEVVRFTYYISLLTIDLLIDIFRILFWLMGFIGLDLNDTNQSPILQQ